MAVGFPASPTIGQKYPTVNPKWEWNGVTWTLISANSWVRLDGSSVMTGKLTVNANGFARGVEVIADDGVKQADITSTTYGVNGGGILHGRHARGTASSPSASQAGDIIGGVGCRAWETGTNGFQLSSPTSIHWVAKENQSSTTRGSCLRILTTKIGQGSRKIRTVFADDGDVNVGEYDVAPTEALRGRGINVIRENIEGEVCIYSNVSPGYRLVQYGGTIASPTATASGSGSFIGFSGYNGINYTGSGALIRFEAAETYSTSGNGSFIKFETTAIGSTSRLERARITPDGNLLVGTTDAAQYGSVQASITAQHVPGVLGAIKCITTTTGLASQVRFVNPNGEIGSISTNGAVVSYNTGSDYRLKYDVLPMIGSLERVLKLRPVTFRWKSDGNFGEGFIAHELAGVCPMAVSGKKDEIDDDGNPVYQSIDQSHLVAILTAAIQEQQSSIKELKSEIEALKASLNIHK